MRISDDTRDFSIVHGGAKSAEYLSRSNEFLCKECRCWTPREFESPAPSICESCFIEYKEGAERVAGYGVI